MKFYCDQCQTKYAIGDDKVQGKILKVRCKKCGFVITVREPTTPMLGEDGSSVAQAASTATSTSIQWYYALNGQTHGPYEEHVLSGMYERAEIGDGTYVWNEGFGETWKLPTDAEPFASVLKRAQALRPRNKTIGVSAALQAIHVEEAAAAYERGQEQGTAPASANAPAPQVKADDFAKRLTDLRSKLQDKPADKPVADKTADKPVADKPADKPAVVAAEKPATKLPEKPADKPAAEKPKPLQLNIKKPAPLVAAPEEVATAPMRSPVEPVEPAETREVERDELAAMLGASSLPVPSPDATFEDPMAVGQLHMGAELGGGDSLPGFGDINAGEATIDFSKLRTNDDAHHFAETASTHGAGEQFEVSNSLLIQMDQIKKQGRGSRVGLGIAAVALIGGLAGIAVTLSIKNSQNKPVEAAPVASEQRRSLEIKRYSNEDRSIFVELAGEDVVTNEDVASAEPAEGKPAEGKSNDVAPVAIKAAEPKNTGSKPIALNTSPKPKNDLLRGTGPLIKNVEGSSLDDAMRASSKTSGTGDAGLATSGKDGSGKAVTAQIDGPKATGGTDWSKIKTERSGIGSSGPIIRPAEGSSAPTNSFANSGLSQEDAKLGFEKVKNSVASCRQRQVARGMPAESVKIAVVLEISPDGSVTDYKLDPPSMQHTEFDLCMQSHTGRWGFKSFTGKPVKIRRTYVLQ
jgi:predicted Zn finger-like uncharacterized protein